MGAGGRGVQKDTVAVSKATGASRRAEIRQASHAEEAREGTRVGLFRTGRD